MKSLLTFFFSLMLTIGFSQGAPGRTTLTVHVSGLTSDQGKVYVVIFNSKEAWLDSAFKVENSTISGGSATAVFENVPMGTYAISTFQDLDNDGQLKLGTFGIPVEPCTSSRGATRRFGPPKWKDAKFTLDSAIATEKINY